MKMEKILIIDEEKQFTDMLTLTLRDYYEVSVENNPCSAVATALKCSPDAILLDEMMLELNGGELQRQIKAEPSLSHIPIHFVTETVRQKDGGG